MEWLIYLLLGLLLLLTVIKRLPVKGVANMSADDLAARVKNKKDQPLIIDVREEHEFKSGHIRGSKNFPLSRLHESAAKLPNNKELVLICRSGNRSKSAAKKLRKQGFQHLINVQGGISSWRGETVKK
ncbi:rhodanese-like domain-containing protein [Salisediminibacterium halotolerans]|uniref:Rhodanese-related sulfurtransferase n=1 Tax=Salisediminibacterium halotolerans TaxID=517425 RepID=A0A1H9UWN1_9BACI|nr:rhodanese-like domain-containing protein [Salisediminibacterium haloalkalitolerans]SES13443.1 Rhodanese-related sulfurtransferase [Salisediminibacterium haloalkalitolerans]